MIHIKRSPIIQDDGAGHADIVVADIGGTHARFAIASRSIAGDISLSHEIHLATSDFADLSSAWAAYAAKLGYPAPRRAAIAVACPVQADLLKFTNNRWVIQPAILPAQLGLEGLSVLNDFEAAGHALAHLAPSATLRLQGEFGIGADRITSVIGPGTGLGGALVINRTGHTLIVPTEAGHIGFSPRDEIERAIATHLQNRFGRVSVERVASGPALLDIYQVLAARASHPAPLSDDKLIWTAALSGDDALAVASLDTFCACLGSAVGDIALAHGAQAVVLAGGLGARLAEKLPSSLFMERFGDKGRFAQRMRAMPIHLLTDTRAGLIGAAAACFASDEWERSA